MSFWAGLFVSKIKSLYVRLQYCRKSGSKVDLKVLPGLIFLKK
jgi:hypothetical protein